MSLSVICAKRGISGANCSLWHSTQDVVTPILTKFLAMVDKLFSMERERRRCTNCVNAFTGAVIQPIYTVYASPVGELIAP